jgi:hypothetical protein
MESDKPESVAGWIARAPFRFIQEKMNALSYRLAFWRVASDKITQDIP